MGKRPDLVGGGLRRSRGVWKNAAEKEINLKRADERILGDPNFVVEVLRAADQKMEKTVELTKSGWDLERLVNIVCSQMSVSKEELKGKGRKNRVSQAKALIAYLGFKDLGVKKTEIARFFGISKQAVGRTVQTGEMVSKN